MIRCQRCGARCFSDRGLLLDSSPVGTLPHLCSTPDEVPTSADTTTTNQKD